MSSGFSRVWPSSPAPPTSPPSARACWAMCARAPTPMAASRTAMPLLFCSSPGRTSLCGPLRPRGDSSFPSRAGYLRSMSQRVGSIKKLLGSARAMRWGMNIWPPFLFTGVRIQHISADFRIARIKLAKTPFTTNYFGTQFGGTMFSMVDAFWAFMLYRNLGSDYVVWDRHGEIDFESPGRTALYAQVVLTEEVIDG